LTTVLSSRKRARLNRGEEGEGELAVGKGENPTVGLKIHWRFSRERSLIQEVVIRCGTRIAICLPGCKRTGGGGARGLLLAGGPESRKRRVEQGFKPVAQCGWMTYDIRKQGFEGVFF